MSYFGYWTNLTRSEKLEIDKQVRKNRFELKFGLSLACLWFPGYTLPTVPFFNWVEGFSPQQIVRDAKDRARAQVESAIHENLDPITESVNECKEAYDEYQEVKKTIESVDNLAQKW